jgi:hypothetical protein
MPRASLTGAGVDHPGTPTRAYFLADALTLSMINMGLSIGFHFLAGRLGQFELAIVGNALFLAPLLALLAVVFAFRDLRHGKDGDVALAALLALGALGIAWWPLLRAD